LRKLPPNVPPTYSSFNGQINLTARTGEERFDMEETKKGSGVLLVRSSLTATMQNKYAKILADMPYLKKNQRFDLMAGFEDGFRSAINSLVGMGVIVVQNEVVNEPKPEQSA